MDQTPFFGLSAADFSGLASMLLTAFGLALSLASDAERKRRKRGKLSVGERFGDAALRARVSDLETRLGYLALGERIYLELLPRLRRRYLLLSGVCLALGVLVVFDLPANEDMDSLFDILLNHLSGDDLEYVDVLFLAVSAGLVLRLRRVSEVWLLREERAFLRDLRRLERAVYREDWLALMRSYGAAVEGVPPRERG